MHFPARRVVKYKDIIKSLDENHLLRLLIDMLDHARVKDIPQETVVKLRNVSPADAMIYDAIYAFECKMIHLLHNNY